MSEQQEPLKQQQTALGYIRSWGGTSEALLLLHHPPLYFVDSFRSRFLLDVPLQKLTFAPDNSVPPTLLATLIAGQHARPLHVLPMCFAPLLLFSSYTNLAGYKKDAAGMSTAWSGLYMLLALRRKQVRGRVCPAEMLEPILTHNSHQKFVSKFSVPGVLRGITLGVCVMNVVGGGASYVLGRREVEAKEQR